MSRRRARRSRRRIAEPLGLEPRGGGARHPRHRRQQHGRRHPRGLGRARPRSARLLAAALRRRRSAARRRAGAAARHAHHRRAAGPGRALRARAAGLQPQGRVHAHLPAEGRRLRCRARWRACSASSRPRPSPGSTPRTCPAEARRIAWHASLRYQHQGFELNVPWAGRDVTEASAAATVAAFHRLHERLYTFAQEDTPVEIVTLRVDARGVFPAPALRELPPAGPLEDARIGHADRVPGDGTAPRPPSTPASASAPAPASTAPPSSPSSTPPRCCCRARSAPSTASAT